MDKKKPSGSGEPKSPKTVGALKPCAQAQQRSTRSGSGTDEEVPLRPLPGYAKESAIDTMMLGSEPIGPQTGKNGPKAQKFVCSQCRMRRWIVDSEAAMAANLTRFSTCLFCDLRGHTDRQIQRQQVNHSEEIKKVQENIEKALGEFSLKLQKLEGGPRQPPTPSPRSPVGLRNEFDALKQQLFSELEALKAQFKASVPEVRAAASPSGGVSNASTIDSPESARGYINDMYRRVVLGPLGGLSVQVGSNAPACPTKVQTTKPVVSTGEGTKNKKKRRGRKKKNPKPGSEAHRDSPPATCLVVGDSLVGRATASHFAKLGPNQRQRALTGAGVKRVTKEVKMLDSAPRNTLVLSVGGNDFFRRDRVPCDSGALMQDYNELLRVAKTKTGRCVVVGLLPRRSYTNRCYRSAMAVNRRLGDLCKVKGLRFVSLWDQFFGKDRLYASCLLYTSPSPRDKRQSRMPSSA